MYDSELHTIGLTWVTAIEWQEDLCYAWDQTSVLRHDDGSFYAETGAGCSCTGPLDDVNSLEDLDGPFDFWQLENYLKEKLSSEPYSANDSQFAADQVAKAISILRNL